MTLITDRKSKLSFMTSDEVKQGRKYRRVVVEVNADGYTANIRLEGTRMRFPISFAGIYTQAVKIDVERKRAEKKKGKR